MSVIVVRSDKEQETKTRDVSKKIRVIRFGFV